MKNSMLSLTMASIIALSANSLSLADPWKNTLDLGLNLTQNSYSNNWVGGEIGSLSWVSLANGIFERQFAPKFNFKNTTKLQFGQTHTQDEVTKDWQKPIKSTDKIDIENVGRFTLQAFVDPYVAFRLESQFLDASYEPVKRLFNPILLTESAGIARSFFKRDKEEVMSRLGFAVKENINRMIGPLAIDTVDENLTTQTAADGGIESVTDAQLKLAANIGYVGKLSLFKALFFSKADDFKGTPAENYWKAVDVNLENGISVAISKYVALNFYTQLLYDKQISLAGRFKETFALGLTYKML
jgi:Protein of unknown function (DUF3078)